MPSALTIDPHLPQILDAVRTHRALVIVAPPGAGKTTRVPPALAEDGPVIVLQPRRIAARSIAQRIARERQWTIGDEVGWQVRFERRFSRRTRVLLATEGILTARLQSDPLLSDFTTIVLDEFHERSVHGDLGLALARQAWLARADLRLVVMSATLQVEPVRAFLNGCPVVDVPGRLHPIEIGYAPGEPLERAVADVLPRTPGSVLCFLPGGPEIRRAQPDVARAAGAGVDVLPLYGSLPADEQDRAIEPSARRRVILATNIAETSLTVPDVTAVIDTGLQKVARYDAARGIDSLEVERIAADAADQRAGRAGRIGPGLVRRLWSETDRLAPHGEPEIARVDLSSTLLAIAAWGGDPRSFEWFEAPDAASIDAGLSLLERLGAIDRGRLTEMGAAMQRLPLHPRLARMLIEARGSRAIALACALLSERHLAPKHPPSTSSDLLSAVEDERMLPPHVREVATQLVRAKALTHTTPVGQPFRTDDEHSFRRAIFAGYADRLAKRREPGSPRFLLASGHGAVLGAESGVRNADFIVAVDVTAGRRGETSEARIRIASAVDEDWIQPTASGVEHWIDARGRVHAAERHYAGAILLSERPAEIDPDRAAELIASERLRRLTDEDRRLARRLRFAQLSIDIDALVRQAAVGQRAVGDIDPASVLPWDAARRLDQLAPERLTLPRGRSVRLDYHDDGSVSASIKLQALFGVTETPRIGPSHTPVTLLLLAPNGRPVQKTTDLQSFWTRTYPEVRKELRGRYPKHDWPENPEP